MCDDRNSFKSYVFCGPFLNQMSHANSQAVVTARTRTNNTSSRYKMVTSLINNQESLFSMGFSGGSMIKSMEGSFVQFSCEIGRTIIKQKWPFYIRIIVISLFILFASTGIMSADDVSTNQVEHFLLCIIEGIAVSPTLLGSQTAVFTALCIIMVLMIGLNSLTVFMLKLYKEGRAPSTFLLHCWIICNRILLPFISLAVGKNAGYFFGRIFHDDITVAIILALIISLINLILFMVANIYQSAIYLATPLVRHSDITQAWFAFSEIDLIISFVPFGYSIIPGILYAFLPDIVVSILFMIIIIASSALLSIYCIINHPYIYPKSNLCHFTVFSASVFYSFDRLLAERVEGSIIYIIIADVVIVLISFFICRYIMSRYVAKIVLLFDNCHSKLEDEMINPLLPYNFLSNQEENQLNFDCFLETNNLTLSLLIRFGYIFDISEVTQHNFAKWVYDTGSKDCNLVFVIVQITFLIGKEMNHLSVMQQNASTFTNAPLNYQSFLVLLKSLREELLTQLNESLMNALGQAKLSNHVLMTIYCEFWGFVLKQNIDGMQNLIPRIADQSHETLMLYNRLYRWYPMSTLVLREMMMFHHKSLGQHTVAMRYYHLFSKYRRSSGHDFHNDFGNDLNNDQSDSTSMSFRNDDETDSKFQQKLDPWLAAEEALDQVSNRSRFCMILFLVIVFFVIFGLSVAIFVSLLIESNTFEGNFDPINHITKVQFFISRIPQLLRIAQFYELEIINQTYLQDSSYGEPFGEELTIMNKSIALESAQQYATLGINEMEDFLSICNRISSIYDTCLTTQIEYYTANSTFIMSTGYEIISSFFNDAYNLLNRIDSVNLKELHKEIEMIRIQKNFDSTFSSTNNILTMLDNSLGNINDATAYKCMLFYIIIWVVSTVVMVSFLFYLIIYVKRDLVYLLRLLFNIPKSEISQLHWSNRVKHKKQIAEDSKKLVNNTTTESNLDISAIKTNTNLKTEEALDGISTVPRRVGGLFTPLIIVSIIFWIVSCALVTVGIYLYQFTMDNSITTSRCYEKCAASASSSLTINYYFQEVIASLNDIISVEEAKQKTLEYANGFITAFNDLLFGNENDNLFPAMFTSTSIINLLSGNVGIIYDRIDLNSTTYNTPFLFINHGSYDYLSLQTLVSMLSEATRIVCKNESSSQLYGYDTPLPYHIQHMTYAHLNTIIQNANREMYNITNNLRKTNQSNILAVFFPLFFFQILFTLTFSQYAIRKMLRFVQIPRTFFKLIMPNVLLHTQPIVKWMAGAVDVNKLAAHHDPNSYSKGINSDFVLPYSKCALIITNTNLIIEQSTDMCFTFFKKTREEMINENVISILSKLMLNKDKGEILDKIKQSVEKMILGRSKSSQRKFTIIIKNENSNNQEMYLELILHGHSRLSDDNDMISIFKPSATSFSFVFFDKTAEHFQEELVQFEKHRGEQLLASFTPPAIFKRLSDGETEIFFEVPTATILFSSITNWSTMIQTLNASDVMKILNKLYMAYDEALKLFPSITKLKTIGNIYIIACGLFSDSSVNHADITIRFSLKMFECICQINDEMGWNLSISVGVNTGGPINCGIIGKVRPIFDIIGDPVNFANKLNSSGIENYIQLSETTYDLIKYLSYPIRERGDIYIKGKGMKKVYLISPQSHLSQSGILKHTTDTSTDNIISNGSTSSLAGKNGPLATIFEEKSSEIVP